jgi:hypothetical protein
MKDRTMTLSRQDEFAAVIAATMATADPASDHETLARRAYQLATALQDERRLRDIAFVPTMEHDLFDADLEGRDNDPRWELEPRWSAEDRARLAGSHRGAEPGPGLAAAKPARDEDDERQTG